MVAAEGHGDRVAGGDISGSISKGGGHDIPVDVGDGEVSEVTDEAADDVGVGSEPGVDFHEGGIRCGHHLEVGGGLPVGLGCDPRADLVGAGNVVRNAEDSEHAGCQFVDDARGCAYKGHQATGLGYGAATDGHYGLEFRCIRLFAKLA